MSIRPTVVGDIGPTPFDIEGVIGGDKNEMIMRITENGEPFDLTGAVIESQARGSNTDAGPAPIVAVISIIDDPTFGHISVSWPGDQVTAALSGKPVWNGMWDLQVTRPIDDYPVTLVYGKFQAKPDVTR